MHLQVFHILSPLHLTVTENAHRSQNRLESYHTLRSAIAKVSGRKALLGRTDLEIEISNQCGLLIASAIIYYNASIHSHLLNKNPKNKKLLKFLKKSSPTAWQHIHFTGYFSFYNKGGSSLGLLTLKYSRRTHPPCYGIPFIWMQLWINYAKKDFP